MHDPGCHPEGIFAVVEGNNRLGMRYMIKDLDV
jgi:hypothetical protein